MDIQAQISNMLLEILGEEFFAVEVAYIDRKPKPKLSIILDGDKGITIDKCAEVSREIAKRIEENDWIPDAYTLEVSSPGVDRPLVLPRQYAQHIGRKLKLQLKDNSIQTGKLIEVQQEAIVIEPETDKKKTTNTDIITLIIAEIQKANVLISFN